MNRIQSNRVVGAVLALALPYAALADFSSTATMNANTSLNLDTGVSGNNAGDIEWTGANMTFIGAAKGGVLPVTGDATYNQINLAELQALAALASQTPIPASAFTVGVIFAIQTNAGNGTKAEVTSVSGTSISFKYTTFGAASGGGGTGTGGGTATPTITAVLNNSSQIPAGFPNSGVAPSTLFVIQGSGLANSGLPVLQDTVKGLPTTLNGSSIKITAGGQTFTPAIYYTCSTSCSAAGAPVVPTSIAAVLPAATPAGPATVTVTLNNVPSAPFTFQVVPSAFGFTTYNGSAVAQIANTAPIITYTNSAKPGDVIILWGTGLGADPADSDTTYTAAPNQIKTPLQIFIGGVQVSSVAYAGASVYPGVHVIGLTIPNNVQTGCFVALAVVSNNTTVSNVVTLPINAGGGVCTDPSTGLNGTTISQLGGQTTVKSGTVFLTQETAPATSGSGTSVTGIAAAVFSSTTSSSFTSGTSVTSGGCVLSQTLTAGGTVTSVGLDAGNITLNGASGPTPLTLALKGTYFAQLAGDSITPGATYTFTGSGGADVGPFTATVNFPNPLLSWTNQAAAATVTRSNSLQATWTGGAPGTYVTITGIATSGSVSGSYTCIAPVAAQQITVPSYVLLGLPAGSGSTTLSDSTTFSPFSATGLDNGLAFGSLSFQVKTTYN